MLNSARVRLLRATFTVWRWIMEQARPLRQLIAALQERGLPVHVDEENQTITIADDGDDDDQAEHT